MRFSLLALALLFAAACQSAPPPVAAPAPRVLDHATQIEMVPANGYAFSRDGRTLIFSANDGEGMRAFSIAVSGGQPTPLASASDTHAISYFPNDDRILLRSGLSLTVRERDETTHNLGGGDFAGWCANGDAIIATATTLFRIDGASYERRALLTLPESRVLDRSVAAVSRDCRWAAITSALTGDIYLADLSATDAAPRRILAHSPAMTYSVFGFTPTNRSLNYSQRQGSGFQEAYRYALAEGLNYPVMQTQADVLAIEYSPTGRYGVYYSGTNARISDVAVVDQPSEQALPLSANTRDLRFNRDETKIAFRLANDGWPNDIFVSDLDGSHITRLVHAPNAR